MSERPILFSAPMVRSVLAGTKTQTRRVIRDDWWICLDPDDADDRAQALTMCPFGVGGTRLWVRETWGLRSRTDETDWVTRSVRGLDSSALDVFQLEYAADYGSNQEACRWRPSIHMPRWASRITLEVTNVRVERLQDISEDDARAEGVTPCARCHGSGIDPVRIGHDADWCRECEGGSQGVGHRDELAARWDSINGKHAPWASNPWVWVVGFKRVQP